MKKLYKSREQKMLGGVCGGIAEYFEVDPVLVRIVFIALTLLHGGGLLAYIIGLIIIPVAPTRVSAETQESHTAQPSAPDYAHQQTSQTTEPRSPKQAQLIGGVMLTAIGLIFLLDHFTFFHRFWHLFHYNFFDYILPAILVIMGALLIARGVNKRKNES